MTDSINYSCSDKAVCRTVLATQGLLSIFIMAKYIEKIHC